MTKKTSKFFDKFPIGFWGYFGSHVIDEEQVRNWAECGMTLTMSPSFETPEGYLPFLDICNKYGIKLIITNDSLTWHSYKVNPEKYRANFRNYVKTLGKHPATAGFFIGDEPCGEDVDTGIEAYKLMLEEAPDLMPYLNFLPYWKEQDGSAILKGMTFEDWSDDFIKKTDCRMLSYDCYTQMNPDDDLNMYFQNLNKFSSAAKRNNIPFLSIILSVGHFRYRVPNEDDIRWQFNTAIACGASAVFWFTFYTVEKRNYRGAPVNAFGDKTPTFYGIKSVQRWFNLVYADIINNSEHLGAYFVEKTYGGLTTYEQGVSGRELGIVNVRSEQGIPAIFSIFEGKGKYEGKKYAMILNNSFKDSGAFYFSLGKEVTKFMIVTSKGEEDFEKNHWDAMFSKSENGAECGVWLAPGQFELFRFE